MPPVHRVVSAQIAASPADVKSFYVDLDNIVDLHPLVVDVRSLSRVATAEGYEQTYRVKDVVPLSFLRYLGLKLPIAYTATLTVPDSGPVISCARQFPRVRLDAVVSFDPEGAGTRLTERIAISAPRLLRGITVGRAVAAHTDMLDGIRRHFSG